MTIKTKKTGLALDIDGTLSQTTNYWVKKMQQLFGNPENLSVEQLITKYQYTQKVPYWQTPAALNWMEEHRNDNDLQTNLPIINNAQKTVTKIEKIIPISAYITARPESVYQGTKIWLEKNNFPQAPVICRPKNIDHSQGNKWKAETLMQNAKNIIGIVDDNPGLLEFIKEKYPGNIFLFRQKTTVHPRAIACPDWNSVYNRIKAGAIK